MRRALGKTILLASALCAFPANADDAIPRSPARLPVAIAERPLTLPPDILAVELEGDVDQQSAKNVYGRGLLEVRYSFTDDLVVGAIVAPIQLAGPVGGFEYGQETGTRGPSVEAIVRLTRGRAEPVPVASAVGPLHRVELALASVAACATSGARGPPLGVYR